MTWFTESRPWVALLLFGFWMGVWGLWLQRRERRRNRSRLSPSERSDAEIVALLDRIAKQREADAAAVEHQVMSSRDGIPILGLKRCSLCGLSETYWKKWPSCPRRKRERGDKK